MGKLSKEDRQAIGVLSVPAALFIVFTALKLAKVIAWSWWWVTSPLWIVASVVFTIVLVYIAVMNHRYGRNE